MQIVKKAPSKLLDREYVELSIDGKGGKITRKEAIAEAARVVGAAEENVSLLRLEGQSGHTTVLGKFYVYGSKEAKKRLQPPYLEERSLTKEEREKLKQERKKATTPAPKPETKK